MVGPLGCEPIFACGREWEGVKQSVTEQDLSASVAAADDEDDCYLALLGDTMSKRQLNL